MVRVQESTAASSQEATQPVQGDWQQIQTDHESLRASAERLEGLLATLAEEAAGAADGHEVLDLLGRFHVQLLDHLDREERQGVLERAVATEPRFARLAGRLRSEHDMLRTHSEALVRGAAQLGWRPLHARFVEFHAIFVGHEEAENDVIWNANLEDLGGRG